MLPPTTFEALLRRDRLIAGTGLIVICLLCWWYVAVGSGTGMSAMAMTTWQFPPPAHADDAASPWDTPYWLTMALMWWTMMIAMMVPSAAPTVLLYTAVYRHAQRKGQVSSASIPTAAFVAGYLVAWLMFSVAATVLQWLLERLGLLHAMLMWSTSTALSGTLLIAAGLFQLSPQKNACLTQCRSPAAFLTQHWHPGRLGAARMGLQHGFYCVGCCWLLMALLFAGGIMNLVWIAALSICVLLEKLIPFGLAFSRACGWLLLAGGGILAATALA